MSDKNVGQKCRTFIPSVLLRSAGQKCRTFKGASHGRLHYYSNIIWPAGGVSIDYNYLKIMNSLHYYLNNDGRLHYYEIMKAPHYYLNNKVPQ